MPAITLHTEENVPEQTELEVGRFRDEFQIRVDNDVIVLKAATAAAGWPDPEPTKLFHRYVVGTDDKGALKTVIRRACVLAKVEPSFYKDTKTEAGHISVKFHISRKTDPKDDTKFVKDDSLSDDGKPTAELVAAAKAAKEANAKK